MDDGMILMIGAALVAVVIIGALAWAMDKYIGEDEE